MSIITMVSTHGICKEVAARLHEGGSGVIPALETMRLITLRRVRTRLLAGWIILSKAAFEGGFTRHDTIEGGEVMIGHLPATHTLFSECLINAILVLLSTLKGQDAPFVTGKWRGPVCMRGSKGGGVCLVIAKRETGKVSTESFDQSLTPTIRAILAEAHDAIGTQYSAERFVSPEGMANQFDTSADE